MFELKYVSKLNHNLIQFLQEKNWISLYCVSFTSVRVGNSFKTSFFSQEIINLDNLLVAANLNR